MSFINTPLGYVLKWMSGLLGGNFALAVLAFTLFINLIMLPLSIKSQKAQANQVRTRPKLAALKKKYGDDRQKLMQEQQALNQNQGNNTAAGCLPMIIRLVIMFAVYDVITSPIQYIAGLNSNQINDAICAAVNSGLIKNASTRGSQIDLFKLIQSGHVEAIGINAGALGDVSFNLLGIDLADTPEFSWNIFGGFQKIWIIPIISFITSVISSVVSMLINKKNNPDAPSMAGMMLAMPFFSLFIAFQVPGAVGFYWAASNIISGGIQSAVQLIYNPNRVVAKKQLKDTIKKYTAESEQIKKLNGNA